MAKSGFFKMPSPCERAEVFSWSFWKSASPREGRGWGGGQERRSS